MQGACKTALHQMIVLIWIELVLRRFKSSCLWVHLKIIIQLLNLGNACILLASASEVKLGPFNAQRSIISDGHAVIIILIVIAFLSVLCIVLNWRIDVLRDWHGRRRYRIPSLSIIFLLLLLHKINLLHVQMFHIRSLSSRRLLLFYVGKLFIVNWGVIASLLIVYIVSNVKIVIICLEIGAKLYFLNPFYYGHICILDHSNMSFLIHQ